MENDPQGILVARHWRDNAQVTPFGMLALFGLAMGLFARFLGWWLGGFTWREAMVMGFAVGALFVALRVVTRD